MPTLPINAIGLPFRRRIGFSTEYQTVRDSWTILPDATVSIQQDLMVRSWIASGFWATRDILYVLAGHTNDNGESLTNWITPGTHDAVIVLNGGTMNFTAFEGFQSDDGAYIDTNYNPSTEGVNYTLNSSSIGIYTRTGTDTDTSEMGAHPGVGGDITSISTSRTTTNARIYINSASAVEKPGGDGYVIGNRPDDSNIQTYRNGSLTGTTAVNSVIVSTINFFILARNLVGNPFESSQKQVSIAHAGGALTPTQIAADTDAFETYMDSNGKGVIFIDYGEVIPIIVGEEITFFGDEVASVPIINDLSVDYICSVGSQSVNDYTITAASEAEISLDIRAYNNGTTIRKTRSLLSIKDKVNTGTKTITIIGNSLVDAGGDDELVQVRAIFDLMTWTGIGLTGIAPNLREGYPGTTYSWMISVEASPFVKAGVVNIPAYYTDNGLAVPDFIYLRQGVNDAFTFGNGFNDAEQFRWVQRINELVDGFLAHDASVEIIVGMPTSSENTGDGWYASYGDTRDQNEYLRIIGLMRTLIIDTYSDYDVRVHISTAPYFLDRDDGYPKTEGVHNNGVHPDASGYVQLGSGLANVLNNLL